MSNMEVPDLQVDVDGETCQFLMITSFEAVSCCNSTLHQTISLWFNRIQDLIDFGEDYRVLDEEENGSKLLFKKYFSSASLF